MHVFIVNPMDMDVVVVARGEGVSAVAAGVGVGARKVDILDVLLEVALGGGGLVAEAAAHPRPVPQHQDVVLKPAGQLGPR